MEALWRNETAPAVREKLAKNNQVMKKRYEEMAALKTIGVEHHYTAGDKVLVK